MVRIAAAAVILAALWLAGSATWDAAVLAVRGEPREGTVVAVTHTSWARADRVEVALPGGERATVHTPRKDLAAGTPVALVVDPDDGSRAALAGDGWPWRQTVLPLLAVPVALVFASNVRPGGLRGAGGRHVPRPDPSSPSD
ncbi:MAG: hypothetical protein AB7R99_01660 [Pseudonocardia sp.]